MADDLRPIGQDERESLERYYEALSPEERRSRIFLQPAYRDAYNELVQAHRTVEQPAYFWDRWVPIIGPVAAVLYMKLRQYCFDRQGQADRDTCWPKQEDLAREIGISSRKSIRAALEQLETEGFIQREASHRVDDRSGRPVRSADRYLVFFEIPLRPKDAVELFVRSVHQIPMDLDPEKERFGPFGSQSQKEPIDPLRDPGHPKRNQSTLYESEKGQKDPYGAGSNRPFTGPEKGQKDPATLNVQRFQRSTLCRDDSTLYEDPLPSQDLAEEVAEVLGDPSSIKFYRLVADKLPEHLIRLALSATAAAEREGALRGRPGAYFTSTIKRLAAEKGIAL